MKSEELLKGTLFVSTGRRRRDLYKDRRRGGGNSRRLPWSTQIVRSATAVNPALKRMRGIVIPSK